LATVHRDADLQPFSISRYAIAESDCLSLRAVPPFVIATANASVSSGTLLQEQAWQCLASNRLKMELFYRWYEERMLGPSDPLASARP
jgi:hypothetical protein